MLLPAGTWRSIVFKSGTFHSLVELQAANQPLRRRAERRPKAIQLAANPDKIIAAVRCGHQALDSMFEPKLARRGARHALLIGLAWTQGNLPPSPRNTLTEVAGFVTKTLGDAIRKS